MSETDNADSIIPEWDAYGPHPALVFAIYGVIIFVLMLVEGWVGGRYFFALFVGFALMLAYTALSEGFSRYAGGSA